MANPFWIRSVNSLCGRSIAVFASICLKDKWTALDTQLQTEKHSSTFSMESNLGYLPAALIACEDARFLEHRGLDLHSIARASIRLAQRRSVEGASTITQQLVRVYTGDYRLSFRRKITEILLATLVDRYYSKEDQIYLYLIRAYFGWRMNGLFEAAKRLQYQHPYSAEQAAGIAARLKYPEPQFSEKKRLQQIASRTGYILAKLNSRR